MNYRKTQKGGCGCVDWDDGPTPHPVRSRASTGPAFPLTPWPALASPIHVRLEGPTSAGRLARTCCPHLVRPLTLIFMLKPALCPASHPETHPDHLCPTTPGPDRRPDRKVPISQPSRLRFTLLTWLIHVVLAQISTPVLGSVRVVPIILVELAHTIELRSCLS